MLLFGDYFKPLATHDMATKKYILGKDYFPQISELFSTGQGL